MIDFEFEFQYAEAKLPILRQVGGGIPALSVWLLAGMVLCGVIGGEAGGRINKRLSESSATRLFEASMLLVMVISGYNIYSFLF